MAGTGRAWPGSGSSTVVPDKIVNLARFSEQAKNVFDGIIMAGIGAAAWEVGGAQALATGDLLQAQGMGYILTFDDG